MNGSCLNGCDRGVNGEKCDKGTSIKNKKCIILSIWILQTPKSINILSVI